ncbi:MAG TPA: acyclic terpene utilization AtuA family protein, partial [Armatimonadota bacterium]|nr:acyclic terpene utilization AtuA family protein [Armatimonadota bacterium]
GSGTGFVTPLQVRRDLGPALRAAVGAGIPLIIGSAGGAGARPHLERTLDIVREIARAEGLHARVASIGADVPAETVIEALGKGRIVQDGPAGELTVERVRSCQRIVGQMGTEPIVRALEAGADVVVAGRACDTAIFAAMPILRGFDPALALHAAKIAECGTLCARPGGANDTLIVTLGADHFIVEPANPDKRCYPDSVAAHSLYEQPDPNCFYEPEGKVDLGGCDFEPFGERGVKVTGTRLEPTPSTFKLEGAALRGYRSVVVAGTCDPGVIEHIDEIEAGVRQAVAVNMARTIAGDEYSLRLLRYGLDAVTGRRISDAAPAELGVVIEAIAPSQELADTVVSLARSTALHQPFEGRKTTAGNLALPFSPSDLQGGAVYEFAVYHLMRGASDALFPVTLEEV